jgi:2-polyprenyl-6-methoxyphenol hydroxylase-like FAD-dependent oxidoreductase
MEDRLASETIIRPDSGSKTFTIDFDDGTREEGIEMLVGADGIYSTVKQKVFPDVRLNYLGVLIVLGIIYFIC